MNYTYELFDPITFIFLKACMFTIYFSLGVFLHLKVFSNIKYTPQVIQIFLHNLTFFELVFILFTLVSFLQLVDFILFDYINNIFKYDLDIFSQNIFSKDAAPSGGENSASTSITHTTTTTSTTTYSTSPQPTNRMLNNGIMATAVGAGVKYGAAQPTLGGKVAVMGAALGAGAGGIVIANVASNMSSDLAKKKDSFLGESLFSDGLNDTLGNLFNLTGNNAYDILNLIHFFLNLQILLVILLAYNLLLYFISDSKLEGYLLKILPIKFVNIFNYYIKYSKKTVKILIICLLVLLLISSVYSSYYLNFFILNLDSIIDLYLKK